MRLEEIFLNTKHEAFRLETLQLYDVPYSKKETEKWFRVQNRLQRRGVKFIRLHLLQFPITEYKAYEIMEHKKRRTRLLAIEKGKIRKRDQKEFWLIDNKTAVMLNFKNYRFVSFKVIRGKRVERLVKLKNSLLKKSKPLFHLLKEKHAEI